VRIGGHDVPAQTVRRRYRAGLFNFFQLYLPMATAGSFATIPRQARGRLRPENGGSCGISAMRRPGAG
jgi:hypothetical protein